VSQILYAGRAVGQSRRDRDAPTCISRIRCASSSVRRLNGLASRDRARREIVDTTTEAVDFVLWRGTVVVVDEKEKRSGTGTPPGSTGRCKAESRDP